MPLSPKILDMWLTTALTGLVGERVKSQITHSQLMNQTLAMVTEKKLWGGISTLTRVAVSEKRNRIPKRLPRTRTLSGMLGWGERQEGNAT